MTQQRAVKIIVVGTVSIEDWRKMGKGDDRETMGSWLDSKQIPDTGSSSSFKHILAKSKICLSRPVLHFSYSLWGNIGKTIPVYSQVKNSFISIVSVS